MGKRPRVRRIGKGAPTYRAPSHKYKAKVRHAKKGTSITIQKIFHDPGHHCPLVEGLDQDGVKHMYFAPENIGIGDVMSFGSGEVKSGNTLSLRDIPDSAPIFNLEVKPNDGGKLVRSSGTFATVVTHDSEKVMIKLPSGQSKAFHPECLATIGVVAGGGRLEKPQLKAGANYHKYKSRAHKWPRTSATAMNAVDHPFGSGRKQKPGRPTTCSRNAPPGQKVGLIAAKRTGRK